MAKKILILEDNEQRQTAMRHCLQDRFYQFEVIFFKASDAMRDYCEQNLAEAILIALDHDLELQPGPNGRCIDPGTWALWAKEKLE